jgi:hypothetical protein
VPEVPLLVADEGLAETDEETPVVGELSAGSLGDKPVIMEAPDVVVGL